MTVEFVDPRAEPGVAIEPYALRLDAGRADLTIGVVANGFPDSVAFLEELDELWEEVKTKDGLGRACEEAVQVAAMALRFLVDLPRKTKRGAAPQAVEGAER